PVDGSVRVENQFGAVLAEVWEEKYVSVSASVEGSAPRFTRSPIVIDNRGKLLSISVFRTPVDPVTTINIAVKIPAAANLEVLTTKGQIILRGLPTKALLRSRAGDIQSSLPQSMDADVNARSTRGTIKSEIANIQPNANDEHTLQAHLGEGSARKRLDLQTDSGQILLSADATATAATATTAQVTRESQVPELTGQNPTLKAAGTPASEKNNEEINEGDVIRVDSQLVTLNTSVIDRSTNRGVVGLTQADFRLFEDGQEQHVVQFESSSAPFDLVLLIDLSGSTKDVVKLIRAAALRFVEAARPADRIAVITFAGQAAIVSNLTANRDELRERINAIDTARGDTKLYDATDFAMNEVMKDAKKSRRTAIVLMSDGLDGTIPGVSGQVGSRLSYRELLNHIQEFDGVLYTLWLNTEYEALNPLDTQPEAFDAGHDRMKEMADAGGGLFYEVEQLTDLAGAYEQVVADLGTVYSLAYRPTNKARDGKWRAIRININRANAVARGKRGYYAN
ncbi:MAG TPA: VWA domain-containing protein, partial [Pyrinomonadaceae bacterium]|nr:VWA domain-containing protein [Pyrinomonadaceae bacterium]